MSIRAILGCHCHIFPPFSLLSHLCNLIVCQTSFYKVRQNTQLLNWNHFTKNSVFTTATCGGSLLFMTQVATQSKPSWYRIRCTQKLIQNSGIHRPTVHQTGEVASQSVWIYRGGVIPALLSGKVSIHRCHLSLRLIKLQMLKYVTKYTLAAVYKPRQPTQEKSVCWKHYDVHGGESMKDQKPNMWLPMLILCHK